MVDTIRMPDNDQSRRIRDKAGEFILQLIKALLQTGYYSSDHPLAKVASKDLYRLFVEVTHDAFEVDFLLLSATDERGILVDGLMPEPVEMSKFLTGTTGEHFVKKFHDYFLRNKIASLTIKRGMEEKEFDTFLELWVTWAAKAAEAEASSAVVLMSDELTSRGVFSVTVVGMKDVPGGVRRLPWPVKIALGRLRSDLTRLPEMKKARPESMSRLKAIVVTDIMRNMTKSDLALDLLLNVDLIIEGTRTFSKPEIEDAIVTALRNEMVPKVSIELLGLLDTLEKDRGNMSLPGRDVIEYKESVVRIVRKTLTHLASLKDAPEHRSLLLSAFEDGHIYEEDLPDSLRRYLKAAHLADRFMSSPDLYMKDFEQCAGPKSYLKYLNVFSLVIPVLLERKEVTALSSIFTIMFRHAHEDAPPFVGRKRFIEETLSVLVRSGCVQTLVDLSIKTPKHERDRIEDGVLLFGNMVVAGLVNALASAEDVSERKAASSMLERIGPVAVPSLVDELNTHKHPWFAVRNIIELLGKLRSGEAIEAIRQYGSHPHPKVREESVHALGLIMGDEGEKLLLKFLQDKEDAVIRRAINHLGAIRSCEPSFLSALNDTIRIRHRNEDEPENIAQAACLMALAQYANAPMPSSPNLESTLLEIVQPSRLKAFLPSFAGIRPKSPDLVKLALEALGAIGGSKCLDVLTKRFANSKGDVRDSASDAAERIRDRLTSQVVQKPLKF